MADPAEWDIWGTARSGLSRVLGGSQVGPDMAGFWDPKEENKEIIMLHAECDAQNINCNRNSHCA